MSETCGDWIRNIKDDLAGELDSSERARLEAHLAICPECRAERTEFEEALGLLTSWPDADPPRHFFVYEEERGRKGWRGLAMRVLPSPRWAYAALALLAAWLMFMTPFRFSIGSGRLVLAWGDEGQVPVPLPAPAPTLEEVRAAVREVLAEERALRPEDKGDQILKAVNSSFADQERKLNQSLAALESRVGQSLEAGDLRVQRNVEASLGRWSQFLAAQHRQDVGELREQVNQAALLGRFQLSQANTIMATLTELRDGRPPFGPE